MKLALIARATVGAAIGLAGTATANGEFDFRSPSGDVVCAMEVGHDPKDQANYGKGAVYCQVKHTYLQPPLADCPLGGREYDLEEGTPSALGCQGGVLVDPPPNARLWPNSVCRLDYLRCRAIGGDVHRQQHRPLHVSLARFLQAGLMPHSVL
jgi:hypothetical protein